MSDVRPFVDHTKQDTERAEAVVEVLMRHMDKYAWRSEYDQPLTDREWMRQQVPFLVDVFKAVRGD